MLFHKRTANERIRNELVSAFYPLLDYPITLNETEGVTGLTGRLAGWLAGTKFGRPPANCMTTSYDVCVFCNKYSILLEIPISSCLSIQFIIISLHSS